MSYNSDHQEVLQFHAMCRRFTKLSKKATAPAPTKSHRFKRGPDRSHRAFDPAVWLPRPGARRRRRRGIIAGHGRTLAALKLGTAELPVVVGDHLTEEEKRAYIPSNAPDGVEDFVRGHDHRERRAQSTLRFFGCVIGAMNRSRRSSAGLNTQSVLVGCTGDPLVGYTASRVLSAKRFRNPPEEVRKLLTPARMPLPLGKHMRIA
jgi:hypothetical protein